MKKLTVLLIALTTICLCISCKSTKVIPEDATAAQIIQMGQNAYSSNHYEDSENYYKTAIERFGDEINVYVEAKYELGHIYVKTKKYDQAESCFNEILEIYDADGGRTLPGTYRKLAQLGLASIHENK